MDSFHPVNLTNYTIIKEDGSHPFNNPSDPRCFEFHITPSPSQPSTPLIAQVTLYSNTAHVIITETGAFSTHIKASVPEDTIDTESATISTTHLQGPSFFQLDVLVNKLAKLLVYPGRDVIFSLSLLKCLKLNAKNAHSEDNDDVEIDDEQMRVMKAIYSRFESFAANGR